MALLKALFSFVVFPGFLFTAVVGTFCGWMERKLTARLQWRKGPPWYQNFVDFFKLLGKETVLPQGAGKFLFLLAPLVGLVGVTVVGTLLGEISLNPQNLSFGGDLIVILYFLILPPLSIFLGGAVSGNPLASLGASREIKLTLAYELPFILSIFTPVVFVGEIKLGEIINFQLKEGMFVFQHFSTFLAFLVALISIQAKLGFVPFDIPEAETEIMAGPLIEYSGTPLGIYKLTRWMLLFVLPLFLITVFLGGFSFRGPEVGFSILKYFLLLFLIILVKNTNPRLRIDQALRFFWLGVFPLSLLAFGLAFLGV